MSLDETRAAMLEHLPRFRLLLDDLGPQRDVALYARAMSALGRLVLFCFKYAKAPHKLAVRLARYADLFDDVLRAPNGAAALALVVRYLHQVGGERPVKKLRLLTAKTDVGTEVEKAMISYAEQLRQEGRKEGQQSARRAVLATQLRARFGEVPEPVTARVASASIKRLDRWLTRILTASTLDDVFSEA